MTPPDNIPPNPAATEEHENRKTTSTKPPEQGLKCPRCDSPNTKFCYYNNYSLTQPRHFCKTCRRYWTKGGALRNVPIGGGCRKNKKIKSLSSYESRDSGNSSSELGGFNFFQGLSPSLDFQGLLSFPPITQFSSASATGIGFNGSSALQGSNSMNINHGSQLASSIESLSSINHDLHWKLQQQRLAMMFGGDNQKDDNLNENQTQQLAQPISFQNLEISKPEILPVGNFSKEGTKGDAATELFFGNSYSSILTTTPTISSGGNGHDNNASNNWVGVNALGDVQQPYSGLP